MSYQPDLILERIMNARACLLRLETAVKDGDEDAVRFNGKQLSVPIAHDILRALPEEPHDPGLSRNWG